MYRENLFGAKEEIGVRPAKRTRAKGGFASPPGVVFGLPYSDEWWEGYEDAKHLRARCPIRFLVCPKYAAGYAEGRAEGKR